MMISGGELILLSADGSKPQLSLSREDGLTGLALIVIDYIGQTHLSDREWPSPRTQLRCVLKRLKRHGLVELWENQVALTPLGCAVAMNLLLNYKVEVKHGT